MRRLSVWLAVAWLGASLAAVGCRGRRGPPERPPPPLVDSTQLGRDFMLRQQVTARAQQSDEARSLQVVVQLADGALVLVGLGPHGARVMQATQHGVEVEQRVLVPIQLPFTALDVLGDVHRVLFRGCEPPPGGDGEVRCQDRGEAVREQWQQGRVVRRSYADAPEKAPHTHITFEGQGEIIAPRVTLENLEYGYALTIETVAQEWL